MDASVTSAAWARYQRNYGAALTDCRGWASKSEIEWLRYTAQNETAFRNGAVGRPLGLTITSFLAKEKAKADAAQPAADVRSESSRGGGRGGTGRGAPAATVDVVTDQQENPVLARRRALMKMEAAETKQRMLYSGVWMEGWAQINRDFRAGLTRLNPQGYTSPMEGSRGGASVLDQSGSGLSVPPSVAGAAATSPSSHRPGSARTRVPTATAAQQRSGQANHPSLSQSSSTAPHGSTAIANGSTTSATSLNSRRNWMAPTAGTAPTVGRSALPPIQTTRAAPPSGLEL